MGEAALVETKVADAMALTKKLDAGGDAPSLVAWYYYDDAENWRLLIAGPTFDCLLPKDEHIAYRKLVEAVSSLSPATLAVSDLKLLRRDALLVRTIGHLVGTPPDGFVNAHFVNTTLNGIFVKEMVIIRSYTR